jgi:hypothetical protein
MPCLPCVQAALREDCRGGLFSSCDVHPECRSGSLCVPHNHSSPRSAALSRCAGSLVPLSFWLACLSFGACDSEVQEEPSCVAACEEGNAKGLELYKSVGGTCACDGCSDACKETVCREGQRPSDTCLPCVQAALVDKCSSYGLFGTGCDSHPECRAYVDCLLACPAN